MTKRPAVLFIYQHGYQRRYYQQLCESDAFAGVASRLAFYWRPRLPAASAPPLSSAEAAAISAFQRNKRTLRGHRPLIRLLRLRAHWEYRGWYRLLKQQGPDVIALWNGNNPGYRAARLAAERLEIPCYAFENGPLPNSTTCDSRGVNARNSLPRSPQFYRRYAAGLSQTERDQQIAQPAINVRQSDKPKDGIAALPERFYFAPFQVHEDSQLLAYSPNVSGMPEFFDWLCHAAEALNVTFVVKQHPSCSKEYDLSHPNVVFANSNDTRQLIEQSDAVVTINSTVGLEAILLNKPVITLGAALYNIEGLAVSADSSEALIGKLKNIENLQPDSTLRTGFMHYLRNHYLLTGNWRDASNSHCEAVKQRLLSS